MKKLTFRIEGETPLLMSNGRLADPLDPIVRQMKHISGKSKKTEADHEQLADLEWTGSLYTNGNGQLIIPGANLEAMLIGRNGAARKQRMGPQAKAGLWVPDDSVLEYDGSKDLDKLRKDDKFRLRAKARVGQASVIRTRPKFDQWACEFTVVYDPDLIDQDTLEEWVEIASFQVGLCDWRPRFGRFKVVSMAEE